MRVLTKDVQVGLCPSYEIVGKLRPRLPEKAPVCVLSAMSGCSERL